MSYILNALRKAEREHQAGKLSTWLDQSTPEHIDRKKSPGFWLLGALILINIATLSFFIWFNPSNSQSSPNFVQEITEILVEKNSVDDELPVLEVGTANLKEEITAKPNIQQASKKNTRESFAEIVTARQEAKAKRIIISNEPPPKISLDKLTGKSKSVQKKMAISPINIKPDPVPEDRANAVSIVLADKKSPNENSQEEAYIPTLKELPLGFRRSVPNININVYVYSEDDAERFVVVDMVKYTSGDMIVDNMELKEIRSDSLVVEYKSETFRIARP